MSRLIMRDPIKLKELRLQAKTLQAAIDHELGANQPKGWPRFELSTYHAIDAGFTLINSGLHAFWAEQHPIKDGDGDGSPGLKTLTCQRCGHVWVPRQLKSTICPKCKSPYWNTPRKLDGEGAK